MTEEEIKALPPEAGDTPVVEQVEPAAAEDEAAKRFQDQLKAAKEREDALRQTADAERNKRLEAERLAQTRAAEIANYKTSQEGYELQVIANAIDAEKNAQRLARADYRAAREQSDFEKEAEAQERLSTATARLVQLEASKTLAEGQRPPADEGRVQQVQRPTDMVEAFIGSATPATQAWLRQHREQIITGPNGVPVLTDRLMAAHFAALDSGHRADTPEYFSFIDGRLTPQGQHTQQVPMNEDADEPASVAAPKRATPVAAPVSRDPPSPGGKQTQTVRMRLTPEQVEMAHLIGDPKKSPREREIQYFNDMQALKAEGRMH